MIWACVALLIFAAGILNFKALSIHLPIWFPPFPTIASNSNVASHPIDRLISQASEDFLTVLSQSPPSSVSEAAADYRERRGRHPPPGFDEWLKWAQEKGSVTTEWLFDQIYEDLEPFWAVPATVIREQSASWPVVLTIRNSVVDGRRVLPPVWSDRDYMWKTMVNDIPHGFLPDIDMPLSMDDTAHIFVPWEGMNSLMDAAEKTRFMHKPEDVVSDYAAYGPVPEEASFEAFPDHPSEPNPWLVTRDTCPPDKSARMHVQDPDFSIMTQFPPLEDNSFTTSGFISNWTAARSACENPNVRNSHGFYVHTLDRSRMNWKHPEIDDRMFTRRLFPVFSPCKLSGVNNDILLPSASDWSTDYFTADNSTWEDKKSRVIWRGAATGGINNETNWTRFHRHRFVSMMNITQLSMTERTNSDMLPAHVPGGSPELPHNFPLPDPERYDLAVLQQSHDLSRWVSTFADVAFTNLFCSPLEDWEKNNKGKVCWYTDSFYTSADGVPMEEFHKYKYLPDFDGHGYSGRFRSFLASGSMAMKSTIWTEWSTSRLRAWVHFVPVDNSLVDWWGLMDYFLGYKPSFWSRAKAREGHDEQARRIAEEGRDWAAKVLRRDDMLVYTWRLILEYARLCDERREYMGYVNDLLPSV